MFHNIQLNPFRRRRQVVSELEAPEPTVFSEAEARMMTLLMTLAASVPATQRRTVLDLAVAIDETIVERCGDGEFDRDESVALFVSLFRLAVRAAQHNLKAVFNRNAHIELRSEVRYRTHLDEITEFTLRSDKQVDKWMSKHPEPAPEVEYDYPVGA